MLDITRIKFGIQFRLFLAIGSILTLMVLTSMVAWVSFSKVDNAVSDLNTSSIPTIVDTLKLANNSIQAASLAPLLSAAKSEEELVNIDKGFNWSAALVAQKIKSLKERLQSNQKLEDVTQVYHSL
jgi:phosphoglycerate-specific signal transduction histidine kinase